MAFGKAGNLLGEPLKGTAPKAAVSESLRFANPGISIFKVMAQHYAKYSYFSILTR